MPRADAADRTAGHPNARAANFSQGSSLLLRARPGAVLVKLNVGASRDSQMEVEFAVKIFQVAMAIDESRQNRPALDIDNFGPFWDRDITSHPHSSNSPR